MNMMRKCAAVGVELRKMSKENASYFYGDDVDMDMFADEEESNMDFFERKAADGWDEGSDDALEKDEYDVSSAALDAICYYEREPKKLAEMFQNLQSNDKATAELAGKQIYDQLNNWIVSIGKKHFPTFFQAKNSHDREDLISQGWVAIFSAAPKYDPYRSTPSTYFYRPILHEMSNYINGFLKKSSGYNTGIQRKIKQAKAKFAAEGNPNPSILDIAFEIGLTPNIVRKSMEVTEAAKTRSLDEMMFDANEYSATGKSARAREDYDAVTGGYADFGNPYACFVQKEDSIALANAMAELPTIQRELLCRLYGIGCKKQNYTEISRETGMTTNRIKKLEAQGKSRLKLDTNLCSAWTGQAAEIEEELLFEPVIIAPGGVGRSLREELAAIEDAF